MVCVCVFSEYNYFKYIWFYSIFTDLPTGLTTLADLVQINGESVGVEEDGNIHAHSGDTLQLQYAAMATPAADIKWQRGSTDLTSGGDITIQTQESFGQSVSILTVNNLGVTASGEYKAIADNRAGIAESSVGVTVLGKQEQLTRR